MLEELTGQAVMCRRCGHGYPDHEAGGGHCHARLGGLFAPAAAFGCMCPHMRWVDPGGPPVGSYRDAPAPSASR